MFGVRCQNWWCLICEHLPENSLHHREVRCRARGKGRWWICRRITRYKPGWESKYKTGRLTSSIRHREGGGGGGPMKSILLASFSLMGKRSQTFGPLCTQSGPRMMNLASCVSPSRPCTHMMESLRTICQTDRPGQERICKWLRGLYYPARMRRAAYGKKSSYLT